MITQKEEISNLAEKVLACFFSVYPGVETQHQDDENFRQHFEAECLRTLAMVAVIMSFWDEDLKQRGILAQAIAAAPLDSPEVAALRMFTFNNFIPKASDDHGELDGRVQWFVETYRAARQRHSLAELKSLH